jgi:hypothetical protein
MAVTWNRPGSMLRLTVLHSSGRPWMVLRYVASDFAPARVVSPGPGLSVSSN